jgi:hypothetical protein
MKKFIDNQIQKHQIDFEQKVDNLLQRQTKSKESKTGKAETQSTKIVNYLYEENDLLLSIAFDFLFDKVLDSSNIKALGKTKKKGII